MAAATRWLGGLWRGGGGGSSSSGVVSRGLLGGLAAPRPMLASPPCSGALGQMQQQQQQQQARGMANHRHKKIVKMAKGYRGRTNCFRIAVQRVEKALQYAYRDRKVKKREFRSIWIQRIAAAVQQYGMTYSRFIPGLRRANIGMDRKVLAELAVTEPFSFKAVVDTVRSVPASSAGGR